MLPTPPPTPSSSPCPGLTRTRTQGSLSEADCSFEIPTVPLPTMPTAFQKVLGHGLEGSGPAPSGVRRSACGREKSSRRRWQEPCFCQSIPVGRAGARLGRAPWLSFLGSSRWKALERSQLFLGVSANPEPQLQALQQGAPSGLHQRENDTVTSHPKVGPSADPHQAQAGTPATPAGARGCQGACGWWPEGTTDPQSNPAPAAAQKLQASQGDTSWGLPIAGPHVVGVGVASCQRAGGWL